MFFVLPKYDKTKIVPKLYSYEQADTFVNENVCMLSLYPGGFLFTASDT